jgi:hypothetical protein
MSQPQDLMGLGMAPALASRVGNAVVAVAGAGTTAGAATKMQGGHIYNVTGTTSNTGAIIDSTVSIGAVLFISCDHGSTASAVIYPPSGATITNGTSQTLAADKNMIVWRYSSTLFFHIILA